MSFVPAPQQANAAANNVNTSSAAAAAPAAPAVQEGSDQEWVFKTRTFDVYWVEKSALMYRDGYAKVCIVLSLYEKRWPNCVSCLYLHFLICKQTFDKETRKAVTQIKQRSSIPLILRDMAPPEGSIFDPAKKWEEEKERRRLEGSGGVGSKEEAGEKSKKSGGKKGGEKKKSTADSIKESNAAEKLKKDHDRDLQKLSNLKTLRALQETSCETTAGRIHRMIKMLHLSVCDLRQGAVNASEAECLDILWALEGMPSFKMADDLVLQEKALKKEAKDDDKKDKKSTKKDSKKEKDKKPSKKDVKDTKEVQKVWLTPEAITLKNLYKEGGDSRGSYKDSIKYARKLVSAKESLISFQLLEMPDRLPPLSRYNRQFKLEDWQCAILQAIDDRQPAVVCAPTSSGKTLLSTYTCKNAKGTVLFVLPSEVLVWQVASTYYQFFKGNVTVCTDQITFQEVSGDAQVYIGTPKALERSISKVRGAAGEEMTKGEREFMILDGGFQQFDYLVLDEVHTLNGPEGDALQRIIKTCNCPVLALSATIGNAAQLRDWFASINHEHLAANVIDAIKPQEVILKEHFARFINLQRYVVTEVEGKDGKPKQKLVKLHPVAAMTPERLKNEPELISALSMTPSDLMDLWKRMRSIFPSTVLEDLDDPDKFFAELLVDSKRVTLDMTRQYETHLKNRLSALSASHPDLYERLRKAQLPPPLEAKADVSEMLYGVVDQLKQSDLLPAIAFQLSTYGAFNMFKTLLRHLESEQLSEFPNYRKDLIKLAREKAQMRKVAAGKASKINEAEAEEEAKAGFVDDSLVQEDTTKPHEKYVLSPAGKRLNFSEVEDIISDMKKSGESVDINHALIRGLRRGIAIYTNEVGFACYRRQVQMLAQKGRLAVVFSDEALAYGVNMPFRSCVFCGDMGSELTPLIAQQMQGRAGRRGLDVQGSVIYLGMDWPYIENLMLGQISQVTGKNPRYPTMVLQQALAASNDPDDTKHFIHNSEEEKAPFATAIRRLQKHQHCFPTVTEEQMEWMCGRTLEEFCLDKPSAEYHDLSTKVIQGLGYVHDDLTLAMDHNVLTMVWEMHDYLPEGVYLCAVLEQMYIRFCYNKTKSYKESDSTQNEFLSVLLHVVDRCEAKEGEESLQQILRVAPSADGKAMNDDAKSLWVETEKILRDQTTLINNLDVDKSEKDILLLPLPAGIADDDSGPSLDKGVYEMLVSKQKGFTESQGVVRRNELKNRIVRLGHICQIVHNNIQQPHGKYSALEVHFRRMFSNIKYSVHDMMTQLTDQTDLTEV
jgi:ATP-dependent RNA helicase DDX60